MITPCDFIINEYKNAVAKKYPKLLKFWPLLSGYDAVSGSFSRYHIIIIKDTGNLDRCFNDIEKFDAKKIGFSVIKEGNIEAVRKNIIEAYQLSPRSYVVLLRKDNKNFQSEIEKMLSFHELKLGIKNRRIFLSYQGVNKEIVTEYKTTLETMGFEPWLDENDLYTGTLSLNFVQGFKESCAAVFIISQDFNVNAAFKKEVEYAIIEKQQKNNMFSIITLIISEGNKKCNVPLALKSYILKEINNNTESILEIIKAIPVQICNYSYFN